MTGLKIGCICIALSECLLVAAVAAADDDDDGDDDDDDDDAGKYRSVGV